MHVSRIGRERPAFDAREQAFNPRSVAANAIAGDLLFVNERVAVRAGHQGSRCILAVHRHQVFGAGENEDIRFRSGGILILWEPFVGFTGNGWG